MVEAKSTHRAASARRIAAVAREAWLSRTWMLYRAIANALHTIRGAHLRPPRPISANRAGLERKP
jgi:hypothetical protein